MKNIEPCLCGDPACPRCFSQPIEDDVPYTDPRDTFFNEGEENGTGGFPS